MSEAELEDQPVGAGGTEVEGGRLDPVAIEPLPHAPHHRRDLLGAAVDPYRQAPLPLEDALQPAGAVAATDALDHTVQMRQRHRPSNRVVTGGAIIDALP